MRGAAPLRSRRAHLACQPRRGYLAFGREEPFVPVLTAENRDAVLAGAASALLDTVDAIERGAFPVDPEEPHLCTFCGFAAVCRKDYVEDL